MTPPLPWTRRDSLVALALLLLPLLFFQPLMGLVGGRQYLAEGDFIDQFMAFAGFAVRELADGRLPLWNPYAYGGAPFWADIQSAVAYPPNLALYLTAAAVWGRLPLLALELSVLLHLGLSAALTYGFARRHLGDRGGALLAALCFGLGGYLSGYPMLQLAILEGVTWLPLLLWAIERAADGDAAADGGQQSAKSGARRPRPDPWQALALALIILAGHPQTALHLGIIGLGFALWMGWGRARSLRPTATYLLSALLALLLSAPGWLPALDFMRRSTRASADYAMLSGGFPPRRTPGRAAARPDPLVTALPGPSAPRPGPCRHGPLAASGGRRGSPLGASRRRHGRAGRSARSARHLAHPRPRRAAALPGSARLRL